MRSFIYLIKAGMASQIPQKRLTCSICSKPVKFCLCNRIKLPRIDNKVAVTILQHRLEVKHPLNSARIASLGFRNVALHPVSDVNLGALVRIRLNNSDLGSVAEENEAQQYAYPPCCTDREQHVTKNDGDAVVALVRKYGVLDLVESIWTSPNRKENRSSFSEILASSEAIKALKSGFVVERFQNCDEMEADWQGEAEFEVAVPAGSVLLFPSDKAVGVNELSGKNREVKNLIVLDATWAKAKRIFKENPWLEFLPHIKLEHHGFSLYSDVRRQPKTGYKSTIESIVHAMKALGDSNPGLDNLLAVFDSMIGDQRRCREERMKKI